MKTKEEQLGEVGEKLKVAYGVVREVEKVDLGKIGKRAGWVLEALDRVREEVERLLEKSRKELEKKL